MNGLFRLCVLAAFALLPAFASAHEMSMAEIEVREMSRGDFLWQWAARNDKRPSTSELKLHWPESCASELNALRCGEKGLFGTLAVDGVGKTYSAALVKVYWLDGKSRVYTLTASQPSVQLYGSADDERGQGEIASAYLVLGVEHILGGIDHLLFVFSLLFLVGFQRKLVWTITAFTAAHSLTLASASLGWITLRSPPVEAIIALSIVLVAAEALHQRMTLARRWPAMLAFLFGLVHGLGFAGALKEVGLPENHLPTALLTFNVGVELGQLVTVGAAWLVWRALRRWPVFERGRVPLLYGIGSVAAFWSWGRVVAILG
jgi:hydrogenase/urease accessory protein HupE